MKTSLYNTVLNIDEGTTLLYNALSDTFVAVRKGNFHLPSEDHEIGILKKNDPLLFEQLLEAGIYVEDTTDEIQIVKDRIQAVDNDDSFFIMHVNPTMDCNFNCWYCYENHQKGSLISDKLIETLLATVQNIISENKSLKTFLLSFFGGEPLLGFDKVKVIIQGVEEICNKYGVQLIVGFTSNGYLITDSIISFLCNYQCSFQITLDGGREDHNKTRFGKGGTPSYDVILNNVKRVANANIGVLLRINYTSKNIGSVEEILHWLTELPMEMRHHITVDFQRVWQDRPLSGVDETYMLVKTLRSDVRKIGYPVHNNRIINGVRDSCYGDKKNYMLVNYDGRIFRCTAREFIERNSVGTLGNTGIDWDDKKMTLRNKLRFSKKICHTCRIAPLCGGGCSQQTYDHYNENSCLFNHSEEAKEEYILERFEEQFFDK